MIRCFILLLYACTISGIGYDAGGGDRTTCGRPFRAGRLYQPPCDLGRLGYCTQAGQLYPWRAVRRFVKDNQGLMRRMYGDQRHGHVLRAELKDDDFGEDLERPVGYHTPIRFAKYEHNEDVDNELADDIGFEIYQSYEEEPRYLRSDLTNDDLLNTKFIISEQEAAIAIKLAELKASAHFRPVSHRSQYTTQRTPSSSPRTPKSTTTQESTTKTTPAANSTLAISKGSNADIKMNDNEIGSNEATTNRWKNTLETTEITSTTTTGFDDFPEHSTTDTTTDSHKPSTTLGVNTIKIDTENNLTKSTTPPTLTDDLAEDLDQSVESSENTEVFSGSDGNAKQADTDPTQTMLFQDMEDNSKKKAPMNFNEVKGMNACPVKEEVVAPFWANNTRGEVLALLNMYPFEQYVHWEKCTFEHRQMYCREGCRCEQQYRLHRLLAYDPSNECRGIFSDWFRFPSCCVCKCYDMPPEYRVTSRSPRFQMPYTEEEKD